MSDPKRYNTRPNSMKTLEVRLRNLLESDGLDEQLFARYRQEIANIIIGQVIAGTRDQAGHPVFLIKGGVAMSFRLGLLARPTRDFDVACRIDRDEAIELLRDALAEGWSGFDFIMKSELQEIRDTGAIRVDIQEQLNGQIFSKVQFEMSVAEGNAGQSYELAEHKLIELDRLGLDAPGEMPMVSVAYLIAQKLHACTDHSDELRPNDRFRDLIDILLLGREMDTDDELSHVRVACHEIFALRGKHDWPPAVTVLSGWDAGYTKMADELNFTPNDVHAAAREVVGFISRVERSGVESSRGALG